MHNEEILLIIDSHIRSSEGSAATALKKVKDEFQTRITAEENKIKQPDGKCKICNKVSSRLHQQIYCIDCYDKFID
jgi:hypothetical protein